MIFKKGNTITFDPEIEWPLHSRVGAKISSIEKLDDGFYRVLYRETLGNRPDFVDDYQTTTRLSNWVSLNEIWERAIESVTYLETLNSYVQDAQF